MMRANQKPVGEGVSRPKSTFPGRMAGTPKLCQEHNVSMTVEAHEAKGSPRLIITSTEEPSSPNSDCRGARRGEETSVRWRRRKKTRRFNSNSCRGTCGGVVSATHRKWTV